MPQVKNILVPIDTHENAGLVVQWAALFARAFHSRLTLLHANEALEFIKSRPGLHGGGFPGFDMTINKWRQQYAQETKATLDQLTAQWCGDLSVSFLMPEGRAPAVIAEAVESTKSDLIVMGTHGRPWYQRAFLGSTAEAVLRRSDIPVAIIHNSVPSPPAPRLQRLLFSTDFSPASRAGEEWLLYLTQHGAHEVVLVHVVDNPLHETYSPDATDFALKHISEESRLHPPRSAQQYWAHAAQVSKDKLQQLRQELLAQPSPVSLAENVAEEGIPADIILHNAAQYRADMIVMSTHGHSGVRRFVLGSVTEKVLRNATCPVFAIPSR